MTRISEEMSPAQRCLIHVVNGVVGTVCAVAQLSKWMFMGLKNFFQSLLRNLGEPLGSIWNEAVKLTVALGEFLVEIGTLICEIIYSVIQNIRDLVSSGMTEARTLLHGSFGLLVAVLSP